MFKVLKSFRLAVSLQEIIDYKENDIINNDNADDSLTGLITDGFLEPVKKEKKPKFEKKVIDIEVSNV